MAKGSIQVAPRRKDIEYNAFQYPGIGEPGFRVEAFRRPQERDTNGRGAGRKYATAQPQEDFSV
jgi:hypothetical protein